MALISSSVTASACDFLILKTVKKRLLTKFSNQTMGCVMLAKIRIGLATILAILSAFNNPTLFGISSPNMIERKVTRMTMIVTAIVDAYGLRKGIFSTTG